MAYSIRFATLRNEDDLVEALLRGTLPMGWLCETNEASEYLGFRVRQVLALAVRYADRDPRYAQLAALKGRVKVTIRPSGVMVSELPRERQRNFALTQAGEIEQASHTLTTAPLQSGLVISTFGIDSEPINTQGMSEEQISKAYADREDTTQKQMEKLDKELPVKIAGEWNAMRVKPTARQWVGIYPSVEALETIQAWAHTQGLMMLYSYEAEGRLTLLSYDPQMEDAQWSADRERFNRAARKVSAKVESPFSMLRKEYGDDNRADGERLATAHDGRSDNLNPLDDAVGEGAVPEGNRRDQATHNRGTQHPRLGSAVPGLADILGEDES